MKKKSKILFTKSAIPFIVSAFGKVVNGHGVINDPQTFEPVRDRHGLILTLENFGGVMNVKGEAVFFANDLLGIIDATQI